MSVLDTVDMPDSATRAHVKAMGIGGISGWVTSITKEGRANIVAPAANELISGMRSALQGGPIVPASALLSAIAASRKGGVMSTALTQAGVTAAMTKAAKATGSPPRDGMQRLPPKGGASVATPTSVANTLDSTAVAAGAVQADGTASSSPPGADVRVHEVIAPKPLLVRAELELNSAKSGELEVGARVHFLERHGVSDGSVRVKVCDVGDGSIESTGPCRDWVTAVTKAGIQNFHTPAEEVVAVKALLVRSGVDTKSERVGMLDPGTRVHVLQSSGPGPDGLSTAGTTRTQLALDGQAMAHGWITSIGKDGVNVSGRSQGIHSPRASQRAQCRHAAVVPTPRPPQPPLPAGRWRKQQPSSILLGKRRTCLDSYQEVGSTGECWCLQL